MAGSTKSRLVVQNCSLILSFSSRIFRYKRLSLVTNVLLFFMNVSKSWCILHNREFLIHKLALLICLWNIIFSKFRGIRSGIKFYNWMSLILSSILLKNKSGLSYSSLILLSLYWKGIFLSSSLYWLIIWLIFILSESLKSFSVRNIVS